MTHSGGATIADGARFDGTYKGGDLTVLGRFEGGLELSGRLHLGPQGRVKGRVRAAAVEIEGEFEGELRADALTFGATARASGTFLAPRLSMREGARVDGALNVEVAVATSRTGAAGQAGMPKATQVAGGANANVTAVPGPPAGAGDAPR